MSEGRLAFCFGLHDHQPSGTFEGVLVEAAERAYRPFLDCVRARPEIRLNLHVSGGHPLGGALVAR